MDHQALEHRAEDAANFLKMLSSAPRLFLLCQMFDRECSVGELAEKTGMRMPTVSQQLSLLRSQGLVETRRDGTTIYYRLVSNAAQEVMNVLYKHFCSMDADQPSDHQLTTQLTTQAPTRDKGPDTSN